MHIFKGYNYCHQHHHPLSYTYLYNGTINERVWIITSFLKGEKRYRITYFLEIKIQLYVNADFKSVTRRRRRNVCDLKSLSAYVPWC